MRAIDGDRLTEMIQDMMWSAWGMAKYKRIRDAMECILRMIRDMPEIRVSDKEKQV